MVSASEVAPATGLHAAPPLVETSHCTLGAGTPEAAASKTAVAPSSTVTLTGSSLTLGALLVPDAGRAAPATRAPAGPARKAARSTMLASGHARRLMIGRTR